MKNHCNELLWGKVQEIWDAFEKGTPTFVVHFAGNLGPLTPGELNRVEQSLAPYRNFTVKNHTLESLAKSIVEAKKPVIDRQIRLVDDQYFERVDGNIRGLIATVQASDLVDMIRNPENPHEVLLDIFDSNVRVYLTSKNRINKSIIESATSETNAEFWYLNNGITMTCDSMEYAPKIRAPVLTVRNVQIVNGEQTSNALFEAQAIDPERFRNVLVLVRVYETKNPEMSLRIAESTNSQTPIKSRDLRANDEIQRKLEETFRDLGYYYERKARQYRGEDKQVRIDALKAAQCYVAYYKDEPLIAAKDRGKIFGELYDQIFNEDISSQRILVALQVYEPIEKMKKDLQTSIRKGKNFDTDLLFLIDGSYHLLWAVSHLCSIRGIDLSDLDQAKFQLKDAIEVMKKAVIMESKRDSAFAYKRYFKSTRPKRHIEMVISKPAT